MLCISVLFGIVSCTNHEKGYKDSISCDAVNLQSQVVNDSFLFARPDKMFLYDSLLIVSDVRLGDKSFYVFSSLDGRYSLLLGNVFHS